MSVVVEALVTAATEWLRIGGLDVEGLDIEGGALDVKPVGACVLDVVSEPGIWPARAYSESRLLPPQYCVELLKHGILQSAPSARKAGDPCRSVPQ